MRKCSMVTVMLLAAGVLAGCATPATLVLKDGREMQARDTPQFDDDTGFYEFEQDDGTHIRVNRDQVITIQDVK